MHFGKSVGIACSSFATTNVDDVFILVTFFAEASTSKTVTPLKITLGQYIRFTVIIIISIIDFGASLLLPSEPIGFLGLLPILCLLERGPARHHCITQSFISTKMVCIFLVQIDAW